MHPLYVRHHGKAQTQQGHAYGTRQYRYHGQYAGVLALYKDPDDDQRRILAQTKTNGRLAPSMQLRLMGGDV